MITFKKFLSEAAMNRSVYADILKSVGSSALIGLEFEMVVPNSSPFFPKQVDRKTEQIKNINSFSELWEYFKLTSVDDRTINLSYRNWLSNKEEEYIDTRWEEYLDDDEVEEDGLNAAESTARIKAGKKFNPNKLTRDVWASQEFNNFSEVITSFKLAPQYGWVDKEENTVYSEDLQSRSNWKLSADIAAKALGEVLNAKVKVSESPGKGYDSWKIVPDTSITNGKLSTGIDDDFKGIGIEIISPPLPAADGIAVIGKVFQFMQDNQLETNTSTGIHINISIPDLAKKLDALKMVLFMGDEYVLKQFDRVTNVFSASQIQHIIDGIQLTGEVPKTGEALLDAAQKSLSSAKYRSVNLGHLEDGYLEFRAAGGGDYHKKLELITDTVGRWLTAVVRASDPTIERNEYLKKVSKLLGRTYDISRKDKLADKSLEQLVRSTPTAQYPGSGVWKDLQADSPDAVLHMALNFGKKLNYEPTFKQISELRKLMKLKGVSLSDLYKASPDNTQAIGKFAMLFKLK
jgi:hypothetical protein